MADFLRLVDVRHLTVNAITTSEDVICSLLRREPTRWDRGREPAAITRFLEAARYHGVLPLLDQALRATKDSDSWPDEILEVCREASRLRAMYELAHRAELLRILAALSSIAVTPLLLKGTALAYNLYPTPILRPRADTDLLIPLVKRTETERCLAQLGYAKNEAIEGEMISYQASWRRTDVSGTGQHLDLHWRINNSPVLANVTDYETLAARSVPVPALGPHARALRPVDALVFACVHRAGHANAPYYVDGVPHHGIDRLIWLYDLHLLVGALSARDLDEFAEVANARMISAICLDALVRTHASLGTIVPERVLNALRGRGTAEPSAHFLSGSRARLMFEDLRAIDAWGDRLRWIRETAFPSARYMRLKYADAALAWLPILYLRRGLCGFARLIVSRDRH